MQIKKNHMESDTSTFQKFPQNIYSTFLKSRTEKKEQKEEKEKKAQKKAQKA